MSFTETDTQTRQVWWIGNIPTFDDFGEPVLNEFIDGKTSKSGLWAIMSPKSWRLNSYGNLQRLGLGYGQRYIRQRNGKFLKVEG